MELGKIGIWGWLDHLSAPEVAQFVQRAEGWGYSALWIPEAVGRDPFALIGYLVARTERMIFATGIANIYARDPMGTKAIWKTISEMAPNRFILGLGVSHAHLVAGQRGHEYKKPVSTMRTYLEAMEKSLYMGKAPEVDAPIVIGALRDKMLELSASAVQGAHPYNVTPAHTKHAREVMGPDALLCPEHMVLHETDATKARAIARERLPDGGGNTRSEELAQNLLQRGEDDGRVVDVALRQRDGERDACGRSQIGRARDLVDRHAAEAHST